MQKHKKISFAMFCLQAKGFLTNQKQKANNAFKTEKQV